ncbi:MAG: polysaccharide deacetylase family protein [Marinilabiliales bacterium]|nr:polysaccharide deacetylase family protein [Marinilabiliales bacterium]
MKAIPLLFVLLLISLTGTLATAGEKPVNKGKIALTFDACMTTGMQNKLLKGEYKSLCNKALLDFLRSEKVAATLFISGLWAESYPELTKELASDPLFEMGNHSYSHRSFATDCYGLATLKKEEKEPEVARSQEVLFRLTGRKPLLFRFPGGCFENEDLQLLKKYGLTTVGWTFASGDAFNPDEEAIVQNVLSKIRPGAIVVFHLMGGKYAPKTEEVIRKIIPELRKRGYSLVKVSDLK